MPSKCQGKKAFVLLFFVFMYGKYAKLLENIHAIMLFTKVKY